MVTNAGQPISIGSELLKTELPAISTTYLILSMPSWGTNTASPGGLSPYWPAAYPGPACLKLNSRAIQFNIAFIPEDQGPTHFSV